MQLHSSFDSRICGPVLFFDAALSSPPSLSMVPPVLSSLNQSNCVQDFVVVLFLTLVAICSARSFPYPLLFVQFRRSSRGRLHRRSPFSLLSAFPSFMLLGSRIGPYWVGRVRIHPLRIASHFFCPWAPLTRRAWFASCIRFIRN